MLEEKQEVFNLKDFRKQIDKTEETDKPKKPKLKYFVLSVLICLTAIATIYLLSEESRVKDISINGNVYLKSDDIYKLSELTPKTVFMFINPGEVENRIKTNPMIDTCKVTLLDNMDVQIDVTENKIIGYSFEDDQNVLILANNKRVTLDKSNLYLIGKVPLIEGFDKDGIILIEKNFKDVDYKMINEISEIHYYPDIKFQNHELIMRDGNYIFTSVYGLNILNRYYNMVSSYDGSGNKCYYVEDISGNAYISACPWEAKQEDDKQDSSKQEDKQEESESEEE